MSIEIHVYHHFDPVPIGEPGAAGTELILAAIQELNVSLQDKLNTVLAEAQETRTVAESIITLLNGISGQLQGVLQGEGTLDEVIASLNDTQAAIVAAVTANTPAAEEPPPAEEPPAEPPVE